MRQRGAARAGEGAVDSNVSRAMAREAAGVARAVARGGDSNPARAIAVQAPFADRSGAFDRKAVLSKLTNRFVILHLASGRRVAVPSGGDVSVFLRKDQGGGACVSKQAVDVMECDMVPERRSSVRLSALQRETLLSRDPAFANAFSQLFVDTGSTRIPVFCAELNKALAAMNVSPTDRVDYILTLLRESNARSGTPTRSRTTVEKWVDGSTVCPLVEDLPALAQALGSLNPAFFQGLANPQSEFRTNYARFTSAVWALNIYVEMIRKGRVSPHVVSPAPMANELPDGGPAPSAAARAFAVFGVQLKRLLQEFGNDQYVLAQVTKVELVEADKLSNQLLSEKLAHAELDAPCTQTAQSLGLGEVPMAEVYEAFKIFEAAAYCLTTNYLISALNSFPSIPLFELVHFGIYDRTNIPCPAKERLRSSLQGRPEQVREAARRFVNMFFAEVDAERFEAHFQQHNIPEGTVKRFLRQLEVINKALPRVFYQSSDFLVQDVERLDGTREEERILHASDSLEKRYGLAHGEGRKVLLSEANILWRLGSVPDETIWRNLNDPLRMRSVQSSTPHAQRFYSYEEIAAILERYGVGGMIHFFPPHSFPQ